MKKQKSMDMKILNELLEGSRNVPQYVIPLSFLEIIDDRPSISIQIWRNLPDHAVQILESVGFSHYNKNTDSLEMTDEFYSSSSKMMLPIPSIKIEEWGKEFSNANSNNYIPTKLWKQLPDCVTCILELAGYVKYDRKTDSIVFVQK